MDSGQSVFDLVVIGGGITGTAIARDAAGRGLSVALVEMGDIASATSSASSKLIQGGLCDLEHYHFRLAQDARAEREVLLRTAPHLVRPMPFLLLHRAHRRPTFRARAGLFVYDRLVGPSVLPPSRRVALKGHPAAAPLTTEATEALEFVDCWGDDARLAVANTMDAAARGAVILTRTRCLALRRMPIESGGDGWRVDVGNGPCGTVRDLVARAVINATGPWVGEVIRLTDDEPANADHPRVRLVRSNHIAVPSLYEGDHGFILSEDDGPTVFILPFEGGFSLVGTTEEQPYHGDPAAAGTGNTDVESLCTAISRRFRVPLEPADVQWTYTALRPRIDGVDADPACPGGRDHVFPAHGRRGRAPLLSVVGGRFTTYRRLAETVVDELAPFFPTLGPPWTASALLPGGDLGPGGLAGYSDEARQRWPWLPGTLLRRWARAYGSQMDKIVGQASRLGDLGYDYGGGLYQAEVDHLVENEFARTVDDIFWRRGKLGLWLGRHAREALDEHLTRRGLAPAPAPWEPTTEPRRPIQVCTVG